MATNQKLGLRDRKRAETRSRIEDVALELVLRDGLEATTVDAISEAAGISPRTFFNYFESKDSAVLGIHPAEVTDELVDAYTSGTSSGDPVPSVVGLLLTLMGSPQSSRARMKQDRVEVVKRHPEILSGQMSQLSARAGRLTEATEKILTRTTRGDSDHSAHAELLLALCAAAVRVAVREWAEDPSSKDPDEGVAGIERRATTLVAELKEGLS